MLGEGAFSPGPAVWVGKREVAHFDDDHTLDVRLTRKQISARRSELKSHPKVALRANTSDWLEVEVASPDDAGFAEGLVRDAIAANRDAPQGLPPSGAELERRRRFH